MSSMISLCDPITRRHMGLIATLLFVWIGCPADDLSDDDTATQDDDTVADDDSAPMDADGDGWNSDEDCDDGDPAMNLDDVDSDGVDTCSGDCQDDAADVHPGATEVCNQVDDDCDGVVPGEEADEDGDGWMPCTGDCDDGDPLVHPDAEEVCGDDVDNDCDGINPRCGPEGLSSLATADIEFFGENLQDEAGNAVASAGDVNGDGFDDILIGANQVSVNASTAGAVYVLLGPSPTAGDLADADIKIYGETHAAWVGYSVAGAGDLDGDGYDEILIGAPQTEYFAYRDGAAYLLYGPIELGSLVISDADSHLVGEDTEDEAGCSVASAGDVDGDGYGDILIGALREDSGGADAGAAYVLNGPIGHGTTMLEWADAKFVGEDSSDQAGVAVAPAGNADGDGYDDVLVGAWQESSLATQGGAVYLLHGPMTGTMDLSLASTKFVGETEYDRAGVSVSSAGDVNGDGLDDILIGADQYNAGPGAVHLFLAPVEGLRGLTSAESVFAGNADLDMAGYSVASAGDVDGDGRSDLLVACPREDVYNHDEGVVSLLYAPPSGGSLASISDARFQGVNTNDYAGNAVSSAGDVNGDGYADVLIGASQIAVNGLGRVYLVFGGPE